MFETIFFICFRRNFFQRCEVFYYFYEFFPEKFCISSRFRLRKEEQTLPNIKQYYVECLSREAKYQVGPTWSVSAMVKVYIGKAERLVHFTKCWEMRKLKAVVNLYSGLTIASAIIFCHTRQSATWLASKMREKGHEVSEYLT